MKSYEIEQEGRPVPAMPQFQSKMVAELFESLGTLHEHDDTILLTAIQDIRQNLVKFDNDFRQAELKINMADTIKRELEEIEEFKESRESENLKQIWKRYLDSIHNMKKKIAAVQEQHKRQASNTEIEKLIDTRLKERETELRNEIDTLGLSRSKLQESISQLEIQKKYSTFKKYFDTLSGYRQKLLLDSEERLEELFREKYKIDNSEITSYTGLFNRSNHEIKIDPGNINLLGKYAKKLARWSDISFKLREIDILNELNDDICYITPQGEKEGLSQYVQRRVREVEIILRLLATEFNLMLGDSRAYRDGIRRYLEPIKELDGFKEILPQINEVIMKNNNVYLTNVNFILDNRKTFEETKPDAFRKNLDRILRNNVAMDLIGTNLLRCVQILDNAPKYQMQELSRQDRAIIDAGKGGLTHVLSEFELDFKNDLNLEFLKISFFSSEFVKGNALYEFADNNHPAVPFNSRDFSEMIRWSKSGTTDIIVDVDKWPVNKADTGENVREGRYYIL